MITVLFAGLSDMGLKRSNNEDMAAMEPSLGYWAVADGMGGEAAGEVASRIFVESAHQIFSNETPNAPREELIGSVFNKANEKIIAEAHEHPEYEGMGCTAELFTVSGDEYHVGHVGDSRTYVCRNGQLRQITRDHSFVQDQVDRGLMSREEARNHLYKNLILRAVGVKEGFAVDVIKGTMQHGDLFLLCSDGLTDMVEDGAIRDTLVAPRDLGWKAEELVRLAKSGGGRDNITVVLCEVVVKSDTPGRSS